MCKGEIRVKLDGPFEHLQSVLYIFAARIASPAKIKIIGLRIFRRLARDSFFLLRRECDAQSLGKATRDFLLDGEHVLQLPVVTLGPDRMPGRDFN